VVGASLADAGNLKSILVRKSILIQPRQSLFEAVAADAEHPSCCQTTICPKQYPQMYALGLTHKTRRKFMMKLLDLAFSVDPNWM
jgi:hypothetical protein